MSGWYYFFGGLANIFPILCLMLYFALGFVERLVKGRDEGEGK